MIRYIDGYTGWLGNEMFQYAALRALGLREDHEIGFPKKSPNLHDIFNIVPDPGQFEVGSLISHIMEPNFHYTEMPKLLSTNTLLSGYFQSYKYFKPYEKEIREDFTFKEPIGKVEDIASIHVRRGDYLELEDHHPTCELSYYMDAIDEFPLDTQFKIFSDDIEWCKDHMFSDRYTFSEGLSAQEDMQLMSKCSRGHIIANSSFSWWAAWLNPNKEKIVVYPSKWFGPAKIGYDTKDLCPKKWIKV